LGRRAAGRAGGRAGGGTAVQVVGPSAQIFVDRVGAENARDQERV
jgi:hypothetical protein